jgi:hypothetical protein
MGSARRLRRTLFADKNALQSPIPTDLLASRSLQYVQRLCGLVLYPSAALLVATSPGNYCGYRFFRLGQNPLNSSFPDSLSVRTSLVLFPSISLDFSSANINGTIPAWITTLRNLK